MPQQSMWLYPSSDEIVITDCSEGDIRLQGSYSSLEGRVEMCSEGGVWATICSTSWSKQEAAVVCRQLGFASSGRIAVHGLI